MDFETYLNQVTHPTERPVCVSGGAVGADTLFGTLANKHSHIVIHAVFDRHRHTDEIHRDSVCIPNDKLTLVDPLVNQAAICLDRRSIWGASKYVLSLIRRNAYQIMYTESVYAIGELDDTGTMVNGGTGWAVEMYKIVCQKKSVTPRIYLLDKNTLQWYSYMYGSFYPVDESEIPTPTGVYTGIGSRKVPKPAAVKMYNFYKERMQ